MHTKKVSLVPINQDLPALARSCDALDLTRLEIPAHPVPAIAVGDITRIECRKTKLLRGGRFSHRTKLCDELIQLAPYFDRWPCFNSQYVLTIETVEPLNQRFHSVKKLDHRSGRKIWGLFRAWNPRSSGIGFASSQLLVFALALILKLSFLSGCFKTIGCHS